MSPTFWVRAAAGGGKAPRFPQAVENIAESCSCLSLSASELPYKTVFPWSPASKPWLAAMQSPANAASRAEILQKRMSVRKKVICKILPGRANDRRKFMPNHGLIYKSGNCEWIGEDGCSAENPFTAGMTANTAGRARSSGSGSAFRQKLRAKNRLTDLCSIISKRPKYAAPLI